MRMCDEHIDLLLQRLLNTATDEERRKVLTAAFEAHEKNLLQRSDRFFLPCRNKNYEWLRTHDIIYLEAHQKYTDLYLCDHGQTIRKVSSHNIGQLFAQLPQQSFVSIHESHVINLDHVDHPEPDCKTLVMDNNAVLEISKRRKHFFFERYLRF